MSERLSTRQIDIRHRVNDSVIFSTQIYRVYDDARALGEAVLSAILSDIPLAYANLSGMLLLHRSIFPTLNTRTVDLSYADLTNSEITYSNLNSIDFSNSLLNNTRIINSKLNYCIFSGATLIGCNVAGTRFVGTNFQNTILIDTDFSLAAKQPEFSEGHMVWATASGCSFKF